MACVDHKYERGAYGVCRRCGGEDPRVEAKAAADYVRRNTVRLTFSIRNGPGVPTQGGKPVR